jgi:7-carboxy-7-deazaguanine synthase
MTHPGEDLDKGSMGLTMAAMPDGSPEIFTSIQGEGPKMGRLTVFARLSACNLYCRWCDTAYTWRWTTARPHDDETTYERRRWQVRMSAEELAADIRRRGPKRVIFTGGEPFLQHRALLPVMRELVTAGFEVEFETNGTILPPAEFCSLPELIVVSPKLANSGIEPSVRIVAESLDGLLRLPQTVLKFVVTGPADFEEIAAIQERFAIDAARIWIMPCGRSAEATSALGRSVIDQVIGRGYNFSPRLHLALFGDTQGT